MSAIVQKIEKVEDHPLASGLSLVHVAGEVVVANKIGETEPRHRYEAGFSVVYVSEGSIVPEYILRDGFWDDKHDKGGLGGNKGNRVKMRRFGGIESRGILLPIELVRGIVTTPAGVQTNRLIHNEAGEELAVVDGDDVSDFIGVTEQAA